MPDLQTRLIEAAVRPFSDNAELKHSAADFLRKRIVTDPDAAMLARWEKVDAATRKSIWRSGLWVLLALVSTGIVVSDFEEISRLAPWGKWLATGSIFTPLPTAAVQRVASKLNEGDKLLLFGNLSKVGKAERKEALWRSAPENPAYFAEYAAAFLDENEKLPPDFLETARRIDPANVWFTYLAAAVEAKDSVKIKARKSKRVAGKMVYESPRSWEILDQARLDRTMALLAEARNQPKCMDYSGAMLRKRIPLLRERTFTENLDSVSCLAEISTFHSLRLLRLAQAIAAVACSSAESGDVPRFEQISDDAERFIRGICSDENGTLVDEMGKSIMVSTLAESFSSAAEMLGREHDVARWKPIEKSLMDTKERRKSREFIVDGKAVESGTITGGIIDGGVELIARQPDTQPPLTGADLKPMRLVEHEILSWVLSYVLWLGIAVGLCWVACYRFRVALLSRKLARRMADLLGSSDWAWILVAGVLLPFAFVMAINRLTPLGGREFGVRGTLMLMPAAHFLGLWFLWLILPVQIVRWRLAKRAGGFGFRGPSWTGWLAVACAAALIPLIGWTAISNLRGEWWEAGVGPDSEGWRAMPWMFWVAVAAMGVAVFWLIVQVSLAIFGRADRQIYRATSSLVLVRVYAAAMLVIATASCGFKASEHYWFKQDWMSKFDASGSGWNAYESKVAVQMRKELREIIGYDR